MELPKRYDAKDAEKKWQQYWEENQVYKFDENSVKPIFSIDTPPPTVSGKMHMGHAFGFSQTDFIARYKRMAGFELFYPFGTDDNGLPTQILVEKLKKVRAKDLGRVKFTELCLKTLKEELRPEYVADWKRIGISCDWDLFYTTIDKHSQRISQWSFLDLVKKGKAYRSNKPAMVCPKCRTSIAQVELEDIKRTSKINHIKVPVEGGESITFATTRPELMMACIAITVHPDDERYKHLVGKKATIPISNVEVPILADNLSKMEFGTGAVYWCPFGDTMDMEFVAKHPELEVKHILNPDGRLNELAGKYVGMKVVEAREAVLKDWEEAGALVKQEPIEQTVNVHERCGTPIEFIAINQWSIAVKDLKEKWLHLGGELNWSPQHMKNRYDNWANGLKWDWNISRQIFFGVPFPVWYCKDCDEPTFASEEQLPVDPTVDKPSVEKCAKCGCSEFISENDIINTWATSALTPQLAIELVKSEEMKKKLYPMNLRPQGHDIISFWLFNSVVKGHLHYDSLPWHDAMINGWALDPKGKKMSKSKGNAIPPQEMIEKYSVDALRFWAGGCKLGDDMPFQEKDLLTGVKFTNKLWNASKFGIMHLEDYKEADVTCAFDKWILSKLHSLVKRSTKAFDEYQYSKVKSEVEQFFWHIFCDQYLEIVKDRLYNPDVRGAENRASGQQGVYHSVLNVLKMMAPIMPYITEEVYQLYFAKKEDKKSIHVSSWPTCDESLISDSYEKTGDIGVEIINAVRKFKSEKQLSMKAEISKLVLKSDQEEFVDSVKSLEDDLKAVLKVKEIVFEGETSLKNEKFSFEIGIFA